MKPNLFVFICLPAIESRASCWCDLCLGCKCPTLVSAQSLPPLMGSLIIDSVASGRLLRTDSRSRTIPEGISSVPVPLLTVPLLSPALPSGLCGDTGATSCLSECHISEPCLVFPWRQLTWQWFGCSGGGQEPLPHLKTCVGGELNLTYSSVTAWARAASTGLSSVPSLPLIPSNSRGTPAVCLAEITSTHSIWKGQGEERELLGASCLFWVFFFPLPCS